LKRSEVDIVQCSRAIRKFVRLCSLTNEFRAKATHTVPCAGLMAIRALSQSCLWHGNTDEVGRAPSDGASQSITLAGIRTRGPGDLIYLQTG